MVVRARLVDAKTGQPIPAATLTLSARGRGEPYYRAGTAVTSRTGAARLIAYPSATTRYRWTFRGTSSHAGATSASVRVGVSPVVTAQPGTVRIVHGAVATVRGSVSPVSHGRRAHLQQLVRGRWLSTGWSGRIREAQPVAGGARGTFAIAVGEDRVGRYRFRVYVPASATLAAGYSRTITIVVR